MSQIKCIKCSATSTVQHGSLYLCSSCYKRAIKEAADNYEKEMSKVRELGASMIRNYVSKYLEKFNKPKVEPNKKKESKNRIEDFWDEFDDWYFNDKGDKDDKDK